MAWKAEGADAHIQVNENFYGIDWIIFKDPLAKATYITEVASLTTNNFRNNF